MNKNAVKAAEVLAKYIVDKYHYGINCNTCNYDYNKYIIKDLYSFCVLDGCDLDINTTVNDLVNCTNSALEIEDNICNTSIEFVDCDILFEGCYIDNFEDNDYLYEEIVTNENTIKVDIVSIIVGGVSYLSQRKVLEITPNNVRIETINGVKVVMNIIDYINSLMIPNFKITPAYINRVLLLIERNSDDTFTITTEGSAFGDVASKGVVITQNGLLSVQLVPKGSYILVASLTSPYDEIFLGGTNCSQYRKC